jgi:hypothetical protein
MRPEGRDHGPRAYAVPIIKNQSSEEFSLLIISFRNGNPVHQL